MMSWQYYWFKQTNHEKKKEDADKRIPDSSKFIVTEEFNRLAKVHFDARIIVALENIATKTK